MKKTFNKIATLILAMIMMVSVVPTTVYAADECSQNIIINCPTEFTYADLGDFESNIEVLGDFKLESFNLINVDENRECDLDADTVFYPGAEYIAYFVVRLDNDSETIYAGKDVDGERRYAGTVLVNGIPAYALPGIHCVQILMATGVDFETMRATTIDDFVIKDVTTVYSDDVNITIPSEFDIRNVSQFVSAITIDNANLAVFDVGMIEVDEQGNVTPVQDDNYMAGKKYLVNIIIADKDFKIGFATKPLPNSEVIDGLYLYDGKVTVNGKQAFVITDGTGLEVLLATVDDYSTLQITPDMDGLVTAYDSYDVDATGIRWGNTAIGESETALYWDAVPNAVRYDIAINGNHISVNTNSADLTSMIVNDGNYTATVTAFNSSNEAITRATASPVLSFKKPHTHSFGEYVVTTPSSCVVAGVMTSTCSCGATQTAPAGLTSHSFVSSVVAPTYAANGYTLYTCATCGYSYTDSYKNKLTVAKPKISKLTSPKSKQIKITWGKKSCEGYQIQLSTDKNFKKGNKTVTIKKGTTVTTTVKNLKGNKKYYVRIRAYRTENGKKYYSDWSSAKSIKTKK